jgi:hypothetical protein
LTNTIRSKTFFFFFAVNILLAAFVWFLIPETKQISLEEIDVLFGGSNHVEKGALLHVEDANNIHGDSTGHSDAISNSVAFQHVSELKE